MKPYLTKIAIYLIVIILFFSTTSGIIAPSQTQSKSIVTALGIDKLTDNFELTAQIIVPQITTSSSQKYEIASGEGYDIGACITDLEFQTGEPLGLAHCFTIIIGDSVCQTNNMSNILDYFARSNNLCTNAVLVHTTDLAKDILEYTAIENKASQDILHDITEYNNNKILSFGTDLYSFLDNTLSPHSTAIMFNLKLEEETETDSSSSSGGSSGDESSGSSSSSTSQTSKTIKNEGKVTVFCKGVDIYTLSNEELRGFSWVDTGTIFDVFNIEHVYSERLTDATINLIHYSTELEISSSFSNNVPVVNINLKVNAKITGILETANIPVSGYNYLKDKGAQDAFHTLVQSQLQSSLDIQNEKGFDLLNFYHLFEKEHYKEWHQYLDTLDNPDAYINTIQVLLKTELIEKD